MRHFLLSLLFAALGTGAACGQGDSLGKPIATIPVGKLNEGVLGQIAWVDREANRLYLPFQSATNDLLLGVVDATSGQVIQKFTLLVSKGYYKSINQKSIEMQCRDSALYCYSVTGGLAYQALPVEVTCAKINYKTGAFEEFEFPLEKQLKNKRLAGVTYHGDTLYAITFDNKVRQFTVHTFVKTVLLPQTFTIRYLDVGIMSYTTNRDFMSQIFYQSDVSNIIYSKFPLQFISFRDKLMILKTGDFLISYAVTLDFKSGKVTAARLEMPNDMPLKVAYQKVVPPKYAIHTSGNHIAVLASTSSELQTHIFDLTGNRLHSYRLDDTTNTFPDTLQFRRAAWFGNNLNKITQQEFVKRTNSGNQGIVIEQFGMMRRITFGGYNVSVLPTPIALLQSPRVFFAEVYTDLSFRPLPEQPANWESFIPIKYSVRGYNNNFSYISPTSRYIIVYDKKVGTLTMHRNDFPQSIGLEKD